MALIDDLHHLLSHAEDLMHQVPEDDDGDFYTEIVEPIEERIAKLEASD